MIPDAVAKEEQYFTHLVQYMYLFAIINWTLNTCICSVNSETKTYHVRLSHHKADKCPRKFMFTVELYRSTALVNNVCI